MKRKAARSAFSHFVSKQEYCTMSWVRNNGLFYVRLYIEKHTTSCVYNVHNILHNRVIDSVAAIVVVVLIQLLKFT